MDNFKSRQSFLGALNGALSTFSEIFDEKLFVEDNVVISGQIVGSCDQIPPNSSNDISSDNYIVDIDIGINRGKGGLRSIHEGSPTTDAVISCDSLTRSQFQRVQHLFSYFAKMKYYSEKLNMMFHRGTVRDSLGPNNDANVVVASEMDVETTKLQEELMASNIREGKQLKIICALRDYLMIEINRSEGADTELKVAEDNLVKMTVERNKYFKIAQQLELNNIKGEKGVKEDKVQATRKPAIPQVVFNSDIPELYCGAFVRKKFGNNFFFGLIVHFSHPFFKVIYEDSDEEEMTYKDLAVCFWPSSVPSTKAAQCRRHAATLGLQVPSDCSGEGIDGSSMRDGLGHSGSSSSSSSSQSYGERSSSSGTNGNMEDASLENTGSSSSSSREANGVSSKRRSHLVKEDQPEQERQCSISTRYNGQRGSERCDKVREKQEVGSLNGRGSDSYGLSPSARKRMRVDVSEASNEMSRITRTGLSAASNVSSSSQNPIDLCEDDSDVTTAETSDLHTGGTPDTPTSSDVALDVAAPQIAVTDVKMNMDEIVETTDAIGLETALFDQPTLEVDSSACVEL